MTASAFDLLELNQRDLRREPIEELKRLLAKVLKGSHLSFVLNEHFEEDGSIVYREACKSAARALCEATWFVLSLGRSAHWVKVKNPKAPGMRREAEEDWRR